jgi:hypothetical protein
VGEYKGDDGSLATIFAPRTPAHFQYGFRVYHEINQAQGIGPTPRAEQFLLRASSTVISSSTAILNPFLTLNIETDNDGVD